MKVGHYFMQGPSCSTPAAKTQGFSGEVGGSKKPLRRLEGSDIMQDQCL
jgi:hypothetical protein